MFSFQQSLTFFKKRDRLPNSKPNLSIMSNTMLRKARKARNTVGSLWKLPVPIPVPIRRNATDVVIHSPRNTWNTARQRMLRAEPATKLDITKSVIRSQGTFQRRVPKKTHVLEEASNFHTVFQRSRTRIISSRDEYAVFQDQSFQGFDHRVWMWNESYFH